MLPTVLASSVIRSAEQGNSHGGVYLVDLERRKFDQVIDWNDQSISWEGRGWDRGLRGIAFHGGYVYIAASDELYVYDQNFKIVASFRSPYLKHCHEIFISGNELFLTSTGFDSLLVFQLAQKRFVRGYHLIPGSDMLQVKLFDPDSKQGPAETMECHLNNVSVVGNRIFVSGTKMNTLWSIANGHAEPYARIPLTTHNARPYKEGVLMNDTNSDRVLYQSVDGAVNDIFSVPRYEESELSWTHLSEDRARQAFGRGLCVTSDGLIVGGSSPSTISVYRPGQAGPITTVKLTNDIRNSIHGLEIWPY